MACAFPLPPAEVPHAYNMLTRGKPKPLAEEDVDHDEPAPAPARKMRSLSFKSLRRRRAAENSQAITDSLDDYNAEQQSLGVERASMGAGSVSPFTSAPAPCAAPHPRCSSLGCLAEDVVANAMEKAGLVRRPQREWAAPFKIKGN